MTVRGGEPQSELTEAVVDSLSGLPYYFANFAAALVVLTAALALYVALSRSHEFRSARDGSAAAAASFTGALLGIALPIASAVITAGALLDQLLWSAATALVQVLAMLAMRRALRGFVTGVDEGRVACGLTLAAIAIAIGVLNAAAAAAF